MKKYNPNVKCCVISDSICLMSIGELIKIMEKVEDNISRNKDYGSFYYLYPKGTNYYLDANIS